MISGPNENRTLDALSPPRHGVLAFAISFGEARFNRFRAGSPMHDPAADKAFLDSFKSYANGSEVLTEVDCAINDDAFAEAILKTVKDMLPITG